MGLGRSSNWVVPVKEKKTLVTGWASWRGRDGQEEPPSSLPGQTVIVELASKWGGCIFCTEFDGCSNIYNVRMAYVLDVCQEILGMGLGPLTDRESLIPAIIEYLNNGHCNFSLNNLFCSRIGSTAQSL